MFRWPDWLTDDNNVGCGLLPIPSRLDQDTAALIRSWLKLDESERNDALAQIGNEHKFTLLGFSERMASLAVRDGNREHVFLGLLALGLDGWRGDWRDNCLVICLHYDAAQRIGVDPAVIFEEAARWLPRTPAYALRTFLHRSPHDRSLAAMGYIAGTDSDGFLYVRTW